MTRLVAAELDKKGIGYEYLNGGVPSHKREALLTNFRENPNSKVFLSTDAGGVGRSQSSVCFNGY
jgi:SNF2 family DNA or RNA helicase